MLTYYFKESKIYDYVESMALDWVSENSNVASIDPDKMSELKEFCDILDDAAEEIHGSAFTAFIGTFLDVCIEIDCSTFTVFGNDAALYKVMDRCERFYLRPGECKKKMNVVFVYGKIWKDPEGR